MYTVLRSVSVLSVSTAHSTCTMYSVFSSAFSAGTIWCRLMLLLCVFLCLPGCVRSRSDNASCLFFFPSENFSGIFAHKLYSSSVKSLSTAIITSSVMYVCTLFAPLLFYSSGIGYALPFCVCNNYFPSCIDVRSASVSVFSGCILSTSFIFNFLPLTQYIP